MHGAVRQHGTELEGEIGRAPELPDRAHQHPRHRLPAELGVRAERRPAAGHELLVGVAETRRGDDAIRGPARTLVVARAVERIEHVLGEARRLLEHRAGELVGVIREAAGSRSGFPLRRSSSSTKRISRSGARYISDPPCLPGPPLEARTALSAARKGYSTRWYPGLQARGRRRGVGERRDDVRGQEIHELLHARVGFERRRVERVERRPPAAASTPAARP